jgi:hypothetical protein
MPILQRLSSRYSSLSAKLGGIPCGRLALAFSDYVDADTLDVVSTLDLEARFTLGASRVEVFYPL